ncbi:hypothetical protein MB46_11355 [Arthrobacter alpinus]|uniref:hypothetical protein n=1 Tax=Arthrobacter alpinus TaxID=656366 RepID=UPI0005C8B057|nr:hypothetical protein [Arthrobacter alpinus]ALV45989.1 hypothetical protein MB46_11355 [Arthrobacter alpinus]
MQIMDKMVGIAVALLITSRQRLARIRGGLATRFPALFPATENSRGDVPGWVLITLMSAVLVAGLLAIAGPALERLFNQAMEQVQP